MPKFGRLHLKLNTIAAAIPIALFACCSWASDQEITRSAMTILRDRCMGCHNERKSEGGYDLSRFERLDVAGDSGKTPVVAMDAEQSELFRRIVTDDISERMPSGADRLAPKDIDTIRAWLKNGTELVPKPQGSIIDWIDGDNRVLKLDGAPKLTKYDRAPFPIFALDSTGDTVYVSGHHEVLVWDLVQQRLLHRWTGFGRFISALAVDDSTGTVAVASGNPGVSGMIHLIYRSSPVIAFRLESVQDAPVALSFSPKLSLLAVGGMDGSIKVYDSQLRTKLYDALAHADQVLAIQWNVEGTQFLTGSRDRTSRAYDSKNLQLMTSYSGHERAVGAVAFVKSGIVTLDETGTLRLWSKSESDRLLTKRTGLPQRLQSIATHSDEISWLDENSFETTVIQVHEETEKPEKPEDKPKKKKVYQFKPVRSFPIESRQITHWTCIRHSSVFAFSTRSGWIHRLDANHLSSGTETSSAELMQLYPISE